MTRPFDIDEFCAVLHDTDADAEDVIFDALFAVAEFALEDCEMTSERLRDALERAIRQHQELEPK